jgi:hypothetical protein
MDYFKTEFKSNNPDTCVYVITHKSEIKESDFNRIIRVKKKSGFTHIDRIDEIEQIVQL